MIGFGNKYNKLRLIRLKRKIKMMKVKIDIIDKRYLKFYAKKLRIK